MEEKIKELLEQVGRPYEMFNEDGTYQGCFYPIQFLYPKVKKYKLRSKNSSKNCDYCYGKLEKYFEWIPEKYAENGDVVITVVKDVFHAGIYVKNNKIIQVFKGRELELNRLKMFKEYKIYRIKKWET